MKRILLTGMSGVGKSTLIAELAARGCSAVDADCDEYSHWVSTAGMADVPGTPVEADRDWVWREDRMHELLARETGEVLFVSGCAANMRRFLPRFDHVVLLSAPAAVIAHRLRTRTTNPYGKGPGELERVLSLIDEVEPHLRRLADREIDTSAGLEAVIATLLDLARRSP
jgi:shikimate kinase